MAVNARTGRNSRSPTRSKMSRAATRRRKATFVAEPLERGFGLTLGNALRRVLLSSLQGAAVTSIKIENVLHEFSSLAGVREDVTDIVLNVKQIALRMQGEGPKRLQLSRHRPGRSHRRRYRRVRRYRGDEPGSRDLPPRRRRDAQHGAHRRHREGLCPRGQQPPGRRADRPDPGRRLYSPVRQVAYKVENTRVGQELDYDKLTLTVETDGTVTPGGRARLCRAHPAGPAAACSSTSRTACRSRCRR